MVKLLIFVLIMLALVSFFWHEEISQIIAQWQSQAENKGPALIKKGASEAKNWWNEEVKETADSIVAKLSAEGKLKIDAWIESKGYNNYGDPLGTIYTGGTPLFNEATGQVIDLYSYILLNHPDIVSELKLENYIK